MSNTSTTRRGLVGWAGALAGIFAAGAGSARAQTTGTAAAKTAGIGADDRMAIIELMARYAWAYDTEDARALASTFTHDGQLEVFGRVLIDGHKDIPAFMEQARSMKGEHGWQHLTDHHLFRDYDGSTCTVYSYYMMPEGDAQGGNARVRAMGYYVSHCIRSDSGWRFTRRSVVRWNGKAPIEI